MSPPVQFIYWCLSAPAPGCQRNEDNPHHSSFANHRKLLAVLFGKLPDSTSNPYRFAMSLVGKHVYRGTRQFDSVHHEDPDSRDTHDDQTQGGMTGASNVFLNSFGFYWRIRNGMRTFLQLVGLGKN
jgi:hypothetical protein